MDWGSPSDRSGGGHHRVPFRADLETLQMGIQSIGHLASRSRGSSRERWLASPISRRLPASTRYADFLQALSELNEDPPTGTSPVSTDDPHPLTPPPPFREPPAAPAGALEIEVKVMKISAAPIGKAIDYVLDPFLPQRITRNFQNFGHYSTQQLRLSPSRGYWCQFGHDRQPTGRVPKHPENP